MQNFTYLVPTEIIFGKDAVEQIGRYASKYGKTALLVYGRGSAVRSGLIDRIRHLLDRWCRR